LNNSFDEGRKKLMDVISYQGIYVSNN